MSKPIRAHSSLRRIRYQAPGPVRSCKIVWPGVTAMRASAPLCIQYARRSHPDERNDPDGGSNRHRDQQPEDDGALRKPPRQCTGSGAPQPITRCFNRFGCHDNYPAQQRGAPVSPERSAWIGGQGTEPYEQNTQQSPDFGRSVAPQPVQV